MKRQLPLLTLLAILCLEGVWFLTMDQDASPSDQLGQGTSQVQGVEAATRSHAASTRDERVQRTASAGNLENPSTGVHQAGLTLELIKEGQTSISAWRLALVDLESGAVINALAPTNPLGVAHFPEIAPGRYALEGGLYGIGAFRMPLVLNGQQEIKIPLQLLAQTKLQIKDAKSDIRLAGVECYLSGSRLLVASSDDGGNIVLRTLKTHLRFEKERYSSSYVFEAEGSSEMVLLRPEVEVRVELAREWREYSGAATASLEMVLQPMTNYAAYFFNAESNIEPAPFDYLRFRSDFPLGDNLWASVMVPEGSDLTLQVQKGGAVVSLKTGALSAGQIVFVPAPMQSLALELYLRNAAGELVKGEVTAIAKGTGRALAASWSKDHWVIAQPEKCAHFEIRADGCAGVWCWQNQGATHYGGFLELQLLPEQTFSGFLEGVENAEIFHPLHLRLESSEYEKGISVHVGWVSKTPGSFETTLAQNGPFQISGLPAQLYAVRLRPVAQIGGAGKMVGEVSLPQSTPFSIPPGKMEHYGVRCLDQSTGASILSFAGSNLALGISTEAEMGLWQGWAEEGEAFVFRAAGYQPQNVSMPVKGMRQLELSMEPNAPMTLKFHDLDADDLASYSRLSVTLMRMLGDDLVTMSFTRDFPLDGPEVQARFPADGEWVVISLGDPGSLAQSPCSTPFLWRPGGSALVEF